MPTALAETESAVLENRREFLKVYITGPYRNPGEFMVGEAFSGKGLLFYLSTAIAVYRDLRRRIWPHADGGNSVTRHARQGPRPQSLWLYGLAGGGVKGGTVYGATDEFGYRDIENPVHVHDLHATLLHLLCFDHEKLTYRYAGRDSRLTDVSGEVVKNILA